MTGYICTYLMWGVCAGSLFWGKNYFWDWATVKKNISLWTKLHTRQTTVNIFQTRNVYANIVITTPSSKAYSLVCSLSIIKRKFRALLHRNIISICWLQLEITFTCNSDKIIHFQNGISILPKLLRKIGSFFRFKIISLKVTFWLHVLVLLHNEYTSSTYRKRVNGRP